MSETVREAVLTMWDNDQFREKYLHEPMFYNVVNALTGQLDAAVALLRRYDDYFRDQAIAGRGKPYPLTEDVRTFYERLGVTNDRRERDA